VADTPSENEDSKKDEDSRASDLIEAAKTRLNLVVDAEAEIRRLEKEDTDFSVGDQWPAELKAQREVEKRPCLTINRLPQFIRQVTNDQRQNRPSIKVSPVDNKADVDTAKIFQGLIRHIESYSDADVAYDTAFDGAVRKGRGFFRITTDYCNPESFDLEAKFKAIHDTSQVYFDPFSVQPDGSDANWALICEDVSRKDYEAAHPDTKLSENNDWAGLSESSKGWISADSAKIAEYFYKTFEEKEIALLSDGRVVDASETSIPQVLPGGLSILKKRKTVVPTIHWAKLNGVEILDESTFPGRFIPIIPVYGDRIFVNGKKVQEGIVRHAKDPQRMLNYWETVKTETIALAPRAPWIIAEGQMKGYEALWKNANTHSYSALPYVPKTVDGIAVPPPQRNAYEPPVQAMSMALAQSSEHMKETTGVYDAAMGARSNETSGRAINARATQAQTSNFHFVDNLARSIKHGGRILVDIIPVVYDVPRAQRILGEDGEAEVVVLNQIFKRNGADVNYDMSAGKYDVSCETGPGFATKRQEASEYMLEFVKAFPAAAPAVGDLIAKAQDWPGAQEFAERLKAMVPPGIIKEKGSGAEIPQEIQAEIQHLQQQNAQLIEALTAKTNQIENKTIELESKERIEMRKLEVHAEIELAKLGSKEGQVLLQAEIGQLNARGDQLNQNSPIVNETGAGAMPPTAPQNFEQQPAGEQLPGGMEY
jgi:hypothetical protein